jgi:hypothetical protein
MLTQVVVWLNAAAGAVSYVALAPVAWLPGWLSATLIAIATGLLMLWVFKHTSNQQAIRHARDRIKANVLALGLFKDSIAVALRAQGRILANAGRLLVHSLPPMLVMMAPMALLLGQLAVWYQARPLAVGDEAVVTVHWREGTGDAMDARLETAPAYDHRAGPVRVPDKQLTCWRIQAMQPGVHQLTIYVADEAFTKELAVGEGFLPVSPIRPAWKWSDALLYPRERPFGAESAVQSIEVSYPQRDSWTSGTDSWLIYWFGISLLAAFAARPLLKVNL